MLFCKYRFMSFLVFLYFQFRESNLSSVLRELLSNSLLIFSVTALTGGDTVWSRWCSQGFVSVSLEEWRRHNDRHDLYEKIPPTQHFGAFRHLAMEWNRSPLYSPSNPSSLPPAALFWNAVMRKCQILVNCIWKSITQHGTQLRMFSAPPTHFWSPHF